MTSGRRSRVQRQTPRRGKTKKSTLGGLWPPSSRTWWGIGGALVVVALAFLLFVPSAPSVTVPSTEFASLTTLGHLVSAGSPGSPGPESVPVPHAASLAGTDSAANGRTVDGIQCNTSEQTIFHVHTHLTIFVDGVARQIPSGIGITPPRRGDKAPEGVFVTGGGCFYWLHTHAADGIIHVESPVQRTYTLGDFFDIWGQPLSRDRVGPATGKVAAFYGGKVYLGNLRNLPLGSHIQIQLDVGKPLVAPESITFPSGL